MRNTVPDSEEKKRRKRWLISIKLNFIIPAKQIKRNRNNYTDELNQQWRRRLSKLRDCISACNLWANDVQLFVIEKLESYHIICRKNWQSFELNMRMRLRGEFGWLDLVRIPKLRPEWCVWLNTPDSQSVCGVSNHVTSKRSQVATLVHMKRGIFPQIAFHRSFLHYHANAGSWDHAETYHVCPKLWTKLKKVKPYFLNFI